ncbi:MAG TPA: dihydroneopterin aldolase [Actinomycetota bacterium]|nr:dihydroneopterin aldolase [Actinomycetota bacterium]
MNTTRLFLSGIRAQGRHGVNPGEKDAPQEFVVDLDLEVEVAGDDISSTVDYRAVADAARRAVTEGSYDLLETLAAAVADAVAALPRVVRATAVVHKPAAAGSLGIDGVAAASSAGGGAGG